MYVKTQPQTKAQQFAEVGENVWIVFRTLAIIAAVILVIAHL
jgi:uncharacterized membrane protein YukC